MPSSSSPWFSLPKHPRIKTLDAAVASIATKLDTILVDGLKNARPPNQDLRDQRPILQDMFECYLEQLVPNVYSDGVQEQVQIYAYERSVFSRVAQLASIADDIAMRAQFDSKAIKDPQVRQRVATDSDVLADEAKELMRNIMKQDLGNKE